MRRLYSFLFVPVTTGLLALGRGDVRTYELKVNREIGTGICEHARIRTAQHHRLLDRPHDDEPQIVTTRKRASKQDDAPALELISVFAYDEDTLRRELESLCPASASDTTQTVFGASTERTAEVPPLDVRLISGSGPSDNRVDLTFFSDGCTFPPTRTYKTRLLKRVRT